MTTKVTFLEDYKVKQGDGAGKQYKKGKDYSLSDSSANHFIMRGIAK